MTVAPDQSGPRFKPPTYRSLIFIGVLLLLAVLLYAAGGPLTPYLIGLILVFVLNPLVDWLQARGMGRGFATMLVIVVGLILLFVFVWTVLATVVEQARSLVTSWPAFSADLQEWLLGSGLPSGIVDAAIEFVDALPETMAELAPDLARTLIVAIGSGIVAIISLAALPFFIYYALSDRPNLVSGAYRLIPEEFVEAAKDIAQILNNVFGAWARGQLLLSTSVGVPVFLGFLILGATVDPFYADFALLFGTIAFFTEFIPIVGAYLAMIPAIIISLAAVGPAGAILTAVLFIAIQFFEGSVLIPRIYSSALALPAAVVLLALVVGVSLGGFFGVLIALPATAAIRAITDYLYRRAAYEPLSAPPGEGSHTPVPPAVEPGSASTATEGPAA
jgi:predicted PurR-regulated permease PerM